MTNFELMMLKIAQEIQKDEEVGLIIDVCNTGNLPCSQCPAKEQCDKNNPEEFEKWLRQEVEHE